MVAADKGPGVLGSSGRSRASLSLLSTPSAMSAGIISVAHQGAGQAIRVGTHLVLARLLSVQAFGLMGLVYSFTTAVELFTDFGIGQKIVSSPRADDPTFLNTAWTLKILRGFALWVIAVVLAWPAAHFYGEWALVYLLPVVGLNAILGGLTSTSVNLAERRLSLGPLVLLQLAGQIVSAGVTITWAWLYPTVWALVAGGLAATATFLLGSHTLLQGPRNHFRWDRLAAREILHFGAWMVPGTVAYFFLVLSHRLILGAFVTAETLGLFNIAAFVGGFMGELMAGLSTRVLLPLFARQEAEGSGTSFMRQVGRARRNLMLLAVPPMCVLVVWAPEAIALLYDPRYEGAGWMTQVLAAGGIVGCITTTAGVLLLARGDSRRHFVSLGWGSVLLAAFIMIGAYWGGWQGIVIALAAAPVARYPGLAWALRCHRAWQPSLDFGTLLGAASLIGLLWGVKMLVG